MIDELVTTGQTDDHAVTTLDTLEAPDEDNNYERATIGPTDDHAVVIAKLDIPEVSDEDDNLTQIETNWITQQTELKMWVPDTYTYCQH